MQKVINIASAVDKWTKGGLTLRSSFYTSRGVNSGDLNSRMLEQIYQGIKVDVGEVEAANFAKFVWKLKDLSASAFIQAFERFWYRGCEDDSFEQEEGTGNRITGNDDTRVTEAFALIGAVLGGHVESVEDVERASFALKMSFCRGHEKEIGHAVKNPYNNRGGQIYSF